MQPTTRTDELEVKQWKTRRKGAISIWDPKIIRAAIPASFKKLDPRVQVKNPVMFVVEIGRIVTTKGCLSIASSSKNTYSMHR